ncbi:hypothetical protein AGMMS49928_00360 [Spirochaetia bacterium]|nr:hypothetical protein AGMMS49928_00360 [Spirochaetia bacterium]
MRFIIRFSDQVVGTLIVIAIAVLIFVVVLLGHRHRWFDRDYLYITYMDSAAGLGLNMAVQYKGFTIGNIKSFELTDDNQVQVNFAIYDTYNDRVREGSVVELAVSPVGLGNHFYFHPGKGEKHLEENAFIPTINSPEANRLRQNGLADFTRHDDSITRMVSIATTLLEDVDKTMVQVQEALTGTNDSSLGRIVQNTEKLIQGTNITVDELTKTINDTLITTRRELDPILADIKTITGQLADPDKMLMNATDKDGFVQVNVEASLKAVREILANLDKSSAMLPSELSQVEGLLTELRAAVKNADDVLVALSRNPLLKNGVPKPANSQSTGTSPRDISF